MRYVDADGCIKSLKIVPKQRRRHKKKTQWTLVFFLHWETFVFSRLSTYKMWLSFIIFLRKQTANLGTQENRKFNFEPHILISWRVGEGSNPWRWEVEDWSMKGECWRKSLTRTLWWRNESKPVFAFVVLGEGTRTYYWLKQVCEIWLLYERCCC